MTDIALLADPIDFASEVRSLATSLRVANPITLGDYINTYGVDSRKLWVNTSGSGTVTHDPTISSLRLQVGTSSGDRALVRSHQWHRYQSGKPNVCEVTGFVDNSMPANQRIDLGLFDDLDGMFFRITNTGYQIIIRSSTSGSASDIVAVSSDSWNRVPSEPNSQNGNVYGIRFKWLGYGPVQFLINDTIVHEEANFDVRAAPYMRQASLPISVEIQNTASSGANSFYFTCSQVQSEGGSEPPLAVKSQNGLEKSVGTVNKVPLLAIRTKTTLASQVNRVITLPLKLSALTEGQRARVELILNPASVTGGTWTSHGTDSSMEVNTGATAFSGGMILDSYELPLSSDGVTANLDGIFSRFREFLRLDADGSTQDVLVISGINTKSGSTTMSANLTWGEIK